MLKDLARATPQTAGAAGGYAKAGTSNDATSQASLYAETLARTGISRKTARSQPGRRCGAGERRCVAGSTSLSIRAPRGAWCGGGARLQQWIDSPGLLSV